MVMVIVLFCVSGIGIYGILIEGMNGDVIILIFKLILDFFVVVIFGVNLGLVVFLIVVF